MYRLKFVAVSLFSFTFGILVGRKAFKWSDSKAIDFRDGRYMTTY